MRIPIFATFLILFSASFAYGVQANTEWIEFTSPEGGFSVLLPREPKFERVTDPQNKEITNYRYTALETSYGFICEYFDITSTGGDLQSFLDATRDGIIRGAGATKIGEEKISLGDYPGREIEMVITVNNETEIRARARIFIVGKRLYSLSFLHTKDMDPKEVAETGTKFFSSFKVTPKK